MSFLEGTLFEGFKGKPKETEALLGWFQPNVGVCLKKRGSPHNARFALGFSSKL